MKAQERRQAIMDYLSNTSTPVKATELAKLFNVSRQIIVGDIALIRAQNIDILATNQGYLLAANQQASDRSRYRGKLACLHRPQDTELELSLIVEQGGYIEDVEIDHPVYGLIRASLNIQSQVDIKDFIEQMSLNQGEMLSSLTQGIHTHTITTPNVTVFKTIQTSLASSNLLYTNQ